MLPDVEVHCQFASTQRSWSGRRCWSSLLELLRKSKEKMSKDSRYWPNEVKQDLKMTPRWSAQMWIDVLAKGGGQKKGFNIV